MKAHLQELLTNRWKQSPQEIHPVSGGSINQTFRVSTLSHTLFCKTNSATKFPHLFEKEARGLILLGQQDVIKVPAVKEVFEMEGQQVLLLEWIKSGEKTNSFWKTFGQCLATLHHIHNASCGLDYDNYMGSIPQQNKPAANWTHFFSEQRIQPLVHQCVQKNLLAVKQVQLFEKLYLRLPELFNEEPPSLLHGDLWSGNFMCNEHSEPVLIDPAIYYGHRSMDLAMTTLFGGFHASFYESYHYHYPLPANYTEQWKVCNLYPLLIHLALFGSSYRQQIDSTLKQFA